MERTLPYIFRNKDAAQATLEKVRALGSNGFLVAVREAGPLISPLRLPVPYRHTLAREREPYPPLSHMTFVVFLPTGE